MGLRRITVTLEPAEREALIDLAQAERRDPRAQAAIIIQQALERAGLIEPAQPQSVFITSVDNSGAHSQKIDNNITHDHTLRF